MQYKISKSVLASGLRDILLYRLKNALDDSVVFSDEDYQNGRESGRTIKVFRLGQPTMNKSVTFSEFRNSDDIVVYHDNRESQGLSEEAYKSRKSFKYNDYNGVIEHCISYLTSE